jgi:hypothetical protein
MMMKKSQKVLLDKAADLLDKLAEKCGGPGGKPGPCPQGGAGKPSAEGGAEAAKLEATKPPKKGKVAKVYLDVDGDDEVIDFLHAKFPKQRSGMPKGATKFATIFDEGQGAYGPVNINFYEVKTKQGKTYTGHFDKNEGQFNYGTASKKEIVKQLRQLQMKQEDDDMEDRDEDDTRPLDWV